MNKKKNFLKNTLILFMGKASTQFLSFILLPLYTSYLTTEQYGIADLIATYVVFFSPILCFQIESASFRFLVSKRDNENESNEIIKSIVSFAIKIICLISFVLFIIECIFKFKYLKLIIIYFMFYTIYSLFQQIARGKGLNIDYAISSCMYGVLTLISNLILIIIFKMGVYGLIISYIISSFTSMIYLGYRIKIVHILVETDNKSNKKKIIKNSLNYSIPLIPGSLSWWVLNLSDRTILTYFISASANGIYSISNKFSSIFIGAFNVVNLAWIESVSLHIDTKDDFLNELYNLIIKIFLMISILMISVIPILYPYFIGNNFFESYKYVPILMLASLFNVEFGLTQSIYVGLKKTKNIAKTSIMCALLNIILDLILIKKLNIYAAAISTLISYFCLFIYQYFDVKKYVKIKLDVKNNLYLIILFIIGCSIYYTNKIYISIGFTLFSGSILFVINKANIIKLKNYIIKSKNAN